VADRFPSLVVDHLSVAVREIAPALAFLRRWLPVTMRTEPHEGYDDQFAWTDFFIGDWKLELIESSRPGSFVERFLARRGEGFHHLSIDVEEGGLDAYTAALERDGLAIVDRGDFGGGDVTAFISPRTSPGILVQFWQVPGFRPGSDPRGLPADSIAEMDGVRYRVDHVGLAVRSIERALGWFRRTFPTTAPRGDGGAHHTRSLWLGGFKIDLIQPAGGDDPLARFLEERGEGFHHIAIHVDRLDLLVARLERDGVRVAAVDGGVVVLPADAHGMRIQLWQEPGMAAR
jgi:catechol 2,3-dioxygenase-like lactoylglutathione lyase family enzyme